MEKQESFWKEASRKIELLLKNPIRINNEDLLIEDLEEPSLSTTVTTSKPKYKSKHSAFNSRYINYQPAVMSILKNSQRLSVANRFRTERTPSPFTKRYNKLTPLDENLLDKTSNYLEIYGQRAGFSFLPKLGNPTKVKSFIIKVREKYTSLYNQLKSEDGQIRLEGIMNYLFKANTMKRFLPRTNREFSTMRSESTMRKRKALFIEKDHSNYIQEQAQTIKELFDPLNEGIIGSTNFYGIIGIFEYSCAGIEGSTLSKLDLTNTKHTRYLNIQVHQLKSLYYKYKQSNLLERDALQKLFQCIEGVEGLAGEILTLLEVRKDANFGQYLSIVPVLLENYAKIMDHLENNFV